MIKNYLRTAWRNLIKNRFYSIINISGLSVGLAVGILILLWVKDEVGFDTFHRQEANIYKLENMVGTGSSRQLWTNTASPIGVLAKKEIAGVQDAVRISYDSYYGLYRYGNKVFNETHTVFTDPSFFSVFDFKLVRGNPDDPFPDANSLVITESTARKYFGEEEALGKVITADNTVNFKVTGVVKDFPRNSSIRADLLFPMTLLEKLRYAGNKEGKNLENDFVQFDINTFLLLKPGFNFSGFADKLRQIHLGIKPDDTDIGYVVLPLRKMHLYHSDGSEGGFAKVRMFVIIALLILVIGCINYVNLSTARSMIRAKEVSLRKIVGAARSQLFLQFVIETTLLFVMACVLAMTLVYILMPLFNRIADKEIVIDFADAGIWRLIGFTMAGSLTVSSIYPALLLSSFEPLKALKGKVSARVSDQLFRKVLVVVQFTFSVVLIAGTMIIGKQLNYIRSRELGYDREHVISCNVIEMGKHLDAVKSELVKQPGIFNVTSASVNIINYGGQTGDNSWPGKEKGETLMLSPIGIDKDFISFFKIKLVEGNGFTGEPGDSAHFILNETAVKAARLKDPVGTEFTLHGVKGRIIGVVKDFHFTTMRRKIDPAIFHYGGFEFGRLYLKTTAKDASKAIGALESQWKRYNAGFSFDYTFLDDAFNKLYLSEQRTGLLYNLFAGIAIFISCLGLLGLAAYTAQLRTREIGIRKVLGASLPGVLGLLAKDFIKLVFLSIAVAIPVAWYVMNQWLEDFAYKVSIGWFVFVLAGGLAMIIALITISFQAVKAAMANPVKSLRSE